MVQPQIQKTCVHERNESDDPISNRVGYVSLKDIRFLETLYACPKTECYCEGTKIFDGKSQRFKRTIMSHSSYRHYDDNGKLDGKKHAQSNVE
jgi:hypothetical protein